MNLERYEYTNAREYKEYDFYSIGPKGRIRKVVQFVRVPAFNIPYYNLVLGDWDDTQNKLDITSVTNNGDAEKVLATVAAIVVDFTMFFDEMMVYATGSTVTRTRRYQMGINKFLYEIEKIFYVYGYTGEAWESFEKNVNYCAFLITRKEFVILEEETESYMISSQKNNGNTKRVYNDRTVDKLTDAYKDPAVIKKTEEAKKFLEEHPFPDELLKKHRK